MQMNLCGEKMWVVKITEINWQRRHFMKLESHVFIESISLFSSGFSMLLFLVACSGSISKQEATLKYT